MLRIIHYRSKCIGCNACTEAASYRWRMSRKDGKSILIGGIDKKGIYNFMAGDDEYDDICISVANCPVKIIKITNEN